MLGFVKIEDDSNTADPKIRISLLSKAQKSRQYTEEEEKKRKAKRNVKSANKDMLLPLFC